MIYRRAAGFANREDKVPMQLNQIFRLSSVTKPIVTVAALRLIEENRLNLNDPVTEYLPDFKPKLKDGTMPIITIHQLLTHTAGLSYNFLEPCDGPYHKACVSDGLDKPGLTMEEELNRIREAGLAFAPGTNWRYSVAMDVVGAVIEQVTKATLPVSVKNLVADPAEMFETGFDPPDKNKLAIPYADGSPPQRISENCTLPFMNLGGIVYSLSRTFNLNSFPSGGGGMNGSAGDVAKLLEIVRSGGKNILNSKTVQGIFTNQIGHLPTFNGPGWGFSYGGALLVNPYKAKTPQSRGTWSWGGAWGHSWFVDPKHKIVLVALTNTTMEGMNGKFTTDIRNAVYQSYKMFN